MRSVHALLDGARGGGGVLVFQPWHIVVKAVATVAGVSACAVLQCVCHVHIAQGLGHALLIHNDCMCTFCVGVSPS